MNEREQEKADFIALVREHEAQLRAGECHPRLLHDIAESYHDVFGNNEEANPQQRVARFLDGDVDLAEAAIEGFRRVTKREDLPTLRDLIRLDEQGSISLFALPVLAGFDDMRPESLDSRTPVEIARATAFYYLTLPSVSGHPDWYRHALDTHPQAVGEALVKVTRSRIRGRRSCSHLYDLADEPAYRKVAGLVAVPLLRGFPTRCTEPQVSALYHILLATVRWEVDGLEELVQTRTAKPDLDVSQRALWLSAGAILAPQRYVPELEQFVDDGEEARSRQVIRFLVRPCIERRLVRASTRGLRTLIGLFGCRYSPWRPQSTGCVTSGDEDIDTVEALISQWSATLASRTDDEARDALQSLVDDPALAPWHSMLRDRQRKQVLARRDATYSVPDVHAVQKTLRNAAPANAADLAALVVDKLQSLSQNIHLGSTDDWRQYWNEDTQSRKVTRPKHEESCRDALLSDLKQLLPGAVDAVPEAHYARDKRADIRVSFKGNAVPVEVKKDSHPRLWSAINDQLAAMYTSAPESGGFGIYLVLWFGGQHLPVPPAGKRPKTPDALRVRLQESLAGPHRHRISVIVLDVSGSPP